MPINLNDLLDHDVRQVFGDDDDLVAQIRAGIQNQT